MRNAQASIASCVNAGEQPEEGDIYSLKTVIKEYSRGIENNHSQTSVITRHTKIQESPSSLLLAIPTPSNTAQT
jgi:hypothetical protein